VVKMRIAGKIHGVIVNRKKICYGGAAHLDGNCLETSGSEQQPLIYRNFTAARRKITGRV
jgi:aspartate 1-decarboxylase